MSIFDERFELNQTTKQNLIYNEHLVRYHLAKQLVKDKTVLEVACGSGYGAKILAEAGAKKVIAVDINQATIEQAQARYAHNNIEYVVDSAEELAKVADNSVEVVTSFETIEHLKNYQQYLIALSRVLTDNGLVVISTPNKEIFQEKNPYHVKEFNLSELTAELNKQFKYVTILKQRNALASFLVGNQSGTPIMTADTDTPALYFVALCSQQPINVKLNSVASLNTVAWQKWNNNPGWLAVNWLYKLLVNLKLINRS